jgi:hypothetical protein
MISRSATRMRVALAFLLSLLCVSVRAGAPAQVSLFDTGISSPAPLSASALSAKAPWTAVPEDKTAYLFQGDAVLLNGRLALVLRRGGAGAELYWLGEAGRALRAVLEPAAGQGDCRLASVVIVENTPGAAAVDAQFSAAGGKSLVVRYQLDIGQVFVKTEARQGALGLRLRAPCRFVVLPDFFADDIVVDATTLPAARAELPSEHFLLHMLPGHEAIVMAVTDSNEEDVRVTLAGRGGQRVIEGSEIAYGKEGKIWVALVEGRGVWHVRDVAEDDAGKVVELDWTTPYPAQWRVDWGQPSGRVDSWEMIVEKPDGRFEKHGWFGDPNTIPADRKRWTTVLGRFEYPCWIDRSGRAYLQPLAKRVRFEGPALIYPINRVRTTPLDAFTVVDLLRATLGVGPCEYILDVESQPAAMKGRATCATRDVLNAIYDAGRQKQEKAAIEDALQQVLVFVRHIRSRIDAYVDFGHEMLAYLDQQKRAHPELSDLLAEMEALTRAIDERFEARKDQIQTPQYVAELADKFRATLVDYEGDDALEKCKVITNAFTTVGGNQDELVGECRMAVKILRQQAGLAMASDPRAAEIAREIRRRTQEVLRNPASYEAPRH